MLPILKWNATIAGWPLLMCTLLVWRVKFKFVKLTFLTNFLLVIERFILWMRKKWVKKCAVENKIPSVEGFQKSALSELIKSWWKESTMDVPSKLQITIHVGLEKTNWLSIQRSNDKELEMAIADFFSLQKYPWSNCWSNKVQANDRSCQTSGKSLRISNWEKIGVSVY